MTEQYDDNRSNSCDHADMRPDDYRSVTASGEVWKRLFVCAWCGFRQYRVMSSYEAAKAGFESSDREASA